MDWYITNITVSKLLYSIIFNGLTAFLSVYKQSDISLPFIMLIFPFVISNKLIGFAISTNDVTGNQPKQRLQKYN